MKPRELRRNVLVKARMRSGQQWSDIHIRNISSRGLMLHMATPPRPGTVIEIRRAAQVIIGRTVWTTGMSCGIRTQDRIDIGAMLSDQPDGELPPERRCDPVRLAVARHERSRALGSWMQFSALVGGAATASLILVELMHGTLASVFASISGALS